jgi:pimeloyl-ACP methyl ester carboxylesterase/GNAT superfamily N-acetyltransferase
MSSLRPPAFTIRSFDASDEAGLIELWSEVLVDALPHHELRRMLRRKLARDPDLIFVATIDERVVGGVLAGYDGVSGWIYHLAVTPARRRSGIGTSLMRAAESALTELGCPNINLQVQASNASVIEFCRALGYRLGTHASLGKLMDGGFADVNGGRLYYEVRGNGFPLVMIHGHTLDTRTWNAQWSAFAGPFCAVRYDLRGYGRSSLPNETYTHHDDLCALLDFLGIRRAHVVGQALGASVAVNFALMYPERMGALILVDPSDLSGYPFPAELNAQGAPIEAAAREGNLDEARRLWLEHAWFEPAREHPSVQSELERIVADYSCWHFCNDNPARPFVPPANERLAQVRARTLVLVGGRDLAVYNLPLAEHLARSIPHASKVVIPGVGHMANMEAPDEVNRLVHEFIAFAEPLSLRRPE